MRAEYKLCLGESVKPVYRALLAEVNQPAPEKGVVSLDIEGDCIVMRIEAKNISGLRALSNSFLQLAYAAYSSIKEH